MSIVPYNQQLGEEFQEKKCMGQYAYCLREKLTKRKIVKFIEIKLTLVEILS